MLKMTITNFDKLPLLLCIAFFAVGTGASSLQGEDSQAPKDLRTTEQRVTIGEGSGYLNYPDAQKTLGLQPGDTLHIAPGTYSGLSLGNLSGTADRPITVKCNPRARFTTSIPRNNRFPNIAHVRFENFRYEEYNSQCMEITGASQTRL